MSKARINLDQESGKTSKSLSLAMLGTNNIEIATGDFYNYDIDRDLINAPREDIYLAEVRKSMAARLIARALL